MERPIEDVLAEFVETTRFHQLPKHVIDYTKNTILKTVAGMLYGSTTPDGKKFVRLIKDSSPQQAGIIGHRVRVPVYIAALANGFFAHSAELEDDCFPTATSDITVVPVVISLADALKLSGKEVIESTAVAYEVMNRFEYAINPGGRVERVEQLGFTPLPFYGVIGAVVAASKVLGLSADQIRSAIGIGIGTSSGFMVNFGTTAHYYESAVACQNGVIAALMAKEGCTGNPDIQRWISGLIGTENLLVNRIAENLGQEPWYATRFWIKKYPVCFLAHRHLDALKEIMAEHKFTPDQIDYIEIDLGPVDAIIDRPEPKHLEDARFSIQHVIASMILDGDVNANTITWEKIRDPRIGELRKKVKVNVHPDWPKEFMSGIAKVKVHLRDGRVLSKERDQVIGSPKYPLTTEQYAELYRKISRSLLTEDQIDRSLELILNLENLSDLEEIIDIIVFRK